MDRFKTLDDFSNLTFIYTCLYFPYQKTRRKKKTVKKRPVHTPEGKKGFSKE